jgi:hypothetical protein
MMFHIFATIFVLFWGANLVSATSRTLQQRQCLDGEVTLEIFVLRPLEDFFYLLLTLRIKGSNQDLLSEYQLISFVTGTSGTSIFCVPSDVCLTVGLDGELLDYSNDIGFSDFSIGYDGIGVSPTIQSFYWDGRTKVFAELGENCQVTCSDDEVLLEIQAVTDPNFHGGNYDWQVLNDLTEEVIYACPVSSEVNVSGVTDFCYWTDGWYFHDQVCLPKDGCNRLVLGSSSLNDSRTRIQVIYGGMLLRDTESVLFDSLRLQDGSNSTIDCPVCETLGGPAIGTAAGMLEQEVEVFFFRSVVVYENAPMMIWNIDDEGSWYSYTNASVPSGTMGYGDRPLQYHRLCIPGCARFTVSVESGNVSFYEYDNSAYQIKVNGIIYGESTLALSGPYEAAHQANYYIGACEQEQVCGYGPSLVQIDIQNKPLTSEDGLNSYYPYDNYGWAINYYDDPSDKYYSGMTVASSSTFSNQGPGQYYRHLFCAAYDYFQPSKESCTVVAMPADFSSYGNVMSFSISVDGRLFNDVIDCSETSSLPVCQDSSYLLTPVGGDCYKVKLSNTVVLGIIMAVIVVALLVGYGVHKCRNSDNPAPVAVSSNGSIATATTPARRTVPMESAVAVPIDPMNYPKKRPQGGLGNGNEGGAAELPARVRVEDSPLQGHSHAQAETATPFDDEEFA